MERSERIIQTFEGFRTTLDESNERRERLIISSRQITSLSKKLIFHLHRISLFPNDPERSKLLTEAQEKAEEIKGCVKVVGDDLRDGNLTYWAYARNISGGVQEYIEAVSFMHYLKYESLINLEQVRQALQAEDGTEPFEITQEDYALGISDLSGELMRYATNCSSTGDFKAALRACTFVRDLKSGLDSAQPYVRDLGKKQSITEQSLLKIEKICYAIQLRILEYADRPEVLAHLTKRAMEESQEVGADSMDVEGGGGGPNDSGRTSGGKRGGRGRGRGRGGARGGFQGGNRGKRGGAGAGGSGTEAGDVGDGQVA